MSFQEYLTDMKFNPKTYLQQVKIKAMYHDYNYNSITFSDDDKYKLQITNPETNKVIKFGANGYNDYIIYLFMVKKGKITYEDAMKHQERFLKRMKKTNDKLYSKKNLSRILLW